MKTATTITRCFHEIAVNAADDAAAQRTAHSVAHAIRAALPPTRDTGLPVSFCCAVQDFVAAVRLNEQYRALKATSTTLDLPVTNDATHAIVRAAETDAESNLVRAVEDLVGMIVRIDDR